MYRHITIVSSSLSSLPLAKALQDDKKLIKVIIPQSAASVIPAFEKLLGKEDILVSSSEKNPPYPKHCDLVIVMGYSYKIASNESVRMVNVHFGPLPENRGPDPVFWTLKQGKRLAYVAVHEITDTFDAGNVLKEKSYDILPGENLGLLMARLAVLCVPLILEVVHGQCTAKPQDKGKVQYNSRPQEHDLRIDWKTMSAYQIEQLTNACNPTYGGAQTTIGGNPVALLEVVPAQLTINGNEPLPPPGSIVHSSAENGLFVICKNKEFLKINIMRMMEGVFTGHKLAIMGTPPGTLLGS